jgi:hypothetical protein
MDPADRPLLDEQPAGELPWVRRDGLLGCALVVLIPITLVVAAFVIWGWVVMTGFGGRTSD